MHQESHPAEGHPHTEGYAGTNPEMGLRLLETARLYRKYLASDTAETEGSSDQQSADSEIVGYEEEFALFKRAGIAPEDIEGMVRDAAARQEEIRAYKESLTGKGEVELESDIRAFRARESGAHATYQRLLPTIFSVERMGTTDFNPMLNYVFSRVQGTSPAEIADFIAAARMLETEVPMREAAETELSTREREPLRNAA